MDSHSAGYIIQLFKTTMYAVHAPHAQALFWSSNVLYQEISREK